MNPSQQKNSTLFHGPFSERQKSDVDVGLLTGAQMSVFATNVQSPHPRRLGRAYPAWSWCIAVFMTASLVFFLCTGVYRALSIAPLDIPGTLPPAQEPGVPPEAQQPAFPAMQATAPPALEVCNEACQRLGLELQALLWVLTAEKTDVQPPAPHVALKLLPEGSLDPNWAGLLQRLERDGFDREELQTLFAGLGSKSYSPAFMAAKIRELYGVQGIGIKTANGAAPERPVAYEQPISDFSIGSCLVFMKQYAKELKDIERQHGVPSHIIIGLLLVETGLGSDLGNHSALRALGSMAATTTPKILSSAGNAKQAQFVRAGALAATLRDKSNWAYNEVKSLIKYSKDNNLDICTIPGSIYGAIGICQFMPSNVIPYAVDGDKDGKANLFSVVDAMYSVANYLEAHGWRGAKTDAQKLEVIKTYNRDDYYAASVLASSKQLSMGARGKISPKLHALAGVARPRASGVFLDPCLRNLKPVPESAKVKPLGNYQLP